MTDTSNINTALIHKLGLQHLTKRDRDAFFTEVGAVYIQTVLLQFVETLTDEQRESISYFAETEPTAEQFLNHLEEHYSSFRDIAGKVAEEMRATAMQ